MLVSSVVGSLLCRVRIMLMLWLCSNCFLVSFCNNLVVVFGLLVVSVWLIVLWVLLCLVNYL